MEISLDYREAFEEQSKPLYKTGLCTPESNPEKSLRLSLKKRKTPAWESESDLPSPAPGALLPTGLTQELAGNMKFFY